jgi:hypothetical protein
MAIRDLKNAWQIRVPRQPERLTMPALPPKMSALFPKADIHSRIFDRPILGSKPNFRGNSSKGFRAN